MILFTSAKSIQKRVCYYFAKLQPGYFRPLDHRKMVGWLSIANNRGLKIAFAISMLVLLLLPMKAIADDIDIDELASLSLEDLLDYKIVTASRKVEKSTDAPSVVTVITREEIESYGANSLGDVLQFIPGTQLLGAPYIPQGALSFRGDLLYFADNHLLILLNGRPIRDGVMGGHNISIYTTFPINIIERIEVIRGPGSVLYGSNAFVGVINIITQKPTTGGNAKLLVDAGSFEGYRGEISGNMAIRDFGFSYGVRGFTEKGWKLRASTAFVDPSFPVIYDSTDYSEQNGSLVANLYYKNLSIMTYYTDLQVNMLGALGYWAFRGKYYAERLFVDANYREDIAPGWIVNANLTHNYYRFTIDADFASHHLASDYIGEAYVSGQVTESFDIIVGGLVENLRMPRIIDYSPIPNTYSLVNASAYCQANYTVSPKLKLNAGTQLIKPDQSDLDEVLRFGAIYKPFHHIGVKLLYGEAYRSAYPAELLIDMPFLTGNMSLKPERINTTDIQLFHQSHLINASVSVFRSNYTDLILAVDDTTSLTGRKTYANIGKSTISGLEFEAKVLITKKISGTGSFTYQYDKEKVIYTPKVIAKAGISYTHANLKAGIFNCYFGKPRENNGAKINPPARAVNLMTFNIIYGVPKIDGLSLNLYIQNLLDEDYYFTEANYNWENTLPAGPGRAIYGRLIYELKL
jgi:outer membrane receptor for ferrienterochelin and colicins